MPPRKKPRILLIDDNKDFGQVLSRKLARKGFRIELAADGREGVEQARRLPPQLVILDWVLPGGLSGPATLRALKSSCESLPVIVMSGIKQGREVEAEARRAGASLFLTKFEFEKLEGLLTRLNGLIAGERAVASGGPLARQGRILVVDDTPSMLALVVEALEDAGYAVITAETGLEGLELAERERPDLTILDIGLPDVSGLEICRRLKSHQESRSMPVMILTAQDANEAERQAFNMHADKFFAKPIGDMPAFLQWVHTMMDRPPLPSGTLEASSFKIDPDAHTVQIGQLVVSDLPSTLFRLFYELASHPGEVLSRKYLVDRVWQNGVRDREVDVSISRLRDRLGPDVACLIESVRGQGFRLNIS